MQKSTQEVSLMQNRKVLLIAGGGTLGTHVANELLHLGCLVDVICLEDKVSNNAKLRFFKHQATDAYLASLFSDTHYDAIVNFIHYTDPEVYKKVYPFLMANTDHLVFLSSYRVYANEQHPITECAPRLYDVVKDEYFLNTEDYAVPKSKCEDWLMREHRGENWTIVRPVISSSERRLDLLLYSGHEILDNADKGIEMPLPTFVKDFSAGMDWAGNSGKLIANLLFKPDAMGEAFTIYSGHSLTWGQLADIYTELTGARFRWTDVAEYEAFEKKTQGRDAWMWLYDRNFDRAIDNSKVLRVTGLGKEDFTPVKDGLAYEIRLARGKA